MGFFNDVGRGALGYSTGGLSELARLGMNSGGRSIPGAPPPRKPMTAADVGISPDLESAFGGIGTAATGAIGKNYSDLATRQSADNATFGRPSGSNSYGPQRLGTQQRLDVGNLEGALGGVEGNTAYNNALQEREYNQNLSLADEAAALNKPDLLQQILGGIGTVGKPIATYAGMRSRSPGSSSASGSGAGTAYDINNPGRLDLGYSW